MINTTKFTNWQAASMRNKLAIYNRVSPNLTACFAWMKKKVPSLTSLGFYGVRPIRDGVALSTHAFGAAGNMDYPDRDRGIALAAVDELIAHSSEAGVQAIHDYYGCRIWRSKRDNGVHGWLKQIPNPKNGMGQSWATYFHIETCAEEWNNGTPFELRFAGEPVWIFDPEHFLFSLYPLNKNKLTISRRTPTVEGFVDLLRYAMGVLKKLGLYTARVDGSWGPQMEAAIRAFQTRNNLMVDGVIGKITWAALDKAA